MPLPISAWNGTGTCLPAASAPTSSTSAAAGIQAEGNNNPVPGHPEINVSSMCVFLVKILALKLSRGSGKTCACGIYRKCKHGNQFASWKLSSEVFSRPVKPHPWPLPRRSTRPHRDTGNAGSDFRIFKALRARRDHRCSAESHTSVCQQRPRPPRHPAVSGGTRLVWGAPGWLPAAAPQCGVRAARPRRSLSGCQAPGLPTGTRKDPCQATGVPGRVQADPCESTGGSRQAPGRSRLRDPPRQKGGATAGSRRGKMTSTPRAARSRWSVPRHTCSRWAL